MIRENSTSGFHAIARSGMRRILLIGGAWLALSLIARAGESGKAGGPFNRIPSDLKPYLSAIGERLQKSGKGTVTATGALSHRMNDLPRTESLRITWRYPLKIQLEQDGKLLSFDRGNPAQAVPADRTAAETVQMLLEDTIEGFFALQKDRAAKRYFGSGFSLEGAKASDPGVDVVLVEYPDIFQRGKPVLKSYWFDSRTKLLGVVAYTSASGVRTHIIVDDWRDIDGEKIPFRIERWENNKLAIQLNLDTAAVSDSSVDSVLGGN